MPAMRRWHGKRGRATSARCTRGLHVFLFSLFSGIFRAIFDLGVILDLFVNLFFESVEPHIHEPVVQVSSGSMKF